MNSAPEPKRIVIAGDVTVDWNLIFFQGAQDTTVLWNANNRARACPQLGGVAMVARLIETVMQGLKATLPVRIHSLQVSEKEIHPSDKRFNHSYAIWSLSGEKEPKCWRVSQYLGIDPAGQVGDALKMEDDPELADLVVLDDANLGFREHAKLWPKALDNAKHCPWIILKLSYPIVHGKLLTYLTEHHPDRLIVVVPANDLRLDNAQISRGLSWEQMAQDTLWELTYGSEMTLLSRCAHVAVSFQADGVALISHSGAGLKCKLFFDPNNLENGWAAGFKGGMVGYNTCLTSAITRYVVAQDDNDPLCQTALERGIQSGLSAIRMLHRTGYQDVGSQLQEARISFPYQLVAAEIEKPGAKFAQADIHAPLGILAPSRDKTSVVPRAGKFTILAQHCCNDLLNLAREIVRKGPDKTLTNIPLGRFGKLLTVDRDEIESYRTIAALIQEYISQEKAEKPISIAVFGTPGSGKSFGIKEIANSLSERIKETTFNLSQMHSPNDLIGALHQVRDEFPEGQDPSGFLG